MTRLRHLLRQNWKMALVIGLIEVLIVAIAPSPISANVYLGGYFANSQCVDTEHVIMNCTILPGIPITSGNFLAGVLSVAGVKDGNLSGWIYQIGPFRDHNDNLYWNTNSWDMGTFIGFYAHILPSSGSWAGMLLRMDMGGTYTYANRCWGYQNQPDDPLYYDMHYLPMNTGEQYFRAGTSTYAGTTYKHFQFGVEGVSRITDYDWSCRECQVGYYTGSRWRFAPAYVTHQSSSWITWRGDYRVRIGDSNYDGVNTAYSGAGDVGWEYTGTTVPDGEFLWIGDWILELPSVPFQIPSGGVQGLVANQETGYPLPYAEVNAYQDQNLMGSCMTDWSGQYHIALMPGIYSIKASLDGFEDKTYTVEVPQNGQFATRNFQLKPMSPGGPYPNKA